MAFSRRFLEIPYLKLERKSDKWSKCYNLSETVWSDQNVEIIAKCCKAINMLKFDQIVQCEQDAEMSE